MAKPPCKLSECFYLNGICETEYHATVRNDKTGAEFPICESCLKYLGSRGAKLTVVVEEPE